MLPSMLGLAVTGDEQLEFAVGLVRPGREVVAGGVGGAVVVSHAEAFVAGAGRGGGPRVDRRTWTRHGRDGTPSRPAGGSPRLGRQEVNSR
ncbi:hypothetical protein FRIGORI9N_10007 [Frigoribacterium sp. 9N]|nr:hypothetical protein FRIGORI9N_10007 [Frigoribacterium sp. 9N]